jgi:hypothetical protein
MRCNHKKPDGARCRANALPGTERCMFHDPAKAAARAAGRQKGGVNRSKPAATLGPDTPDLPLKSVADVVAALGQTINQVRSGRLAVNVGNCLGVLAGVLLKAIEGGELEQRLAALEARQPHGRVR